jgi:hypothetical protein
VRTCSYTEDLGEEDCELRGWVWVNVASCCMKTSSVCSIGIATEDAAQDRGAICNDGEFLLTADK